jgi:hypothetical protein
MKMTTVAGLLTAALLLSGAGYSQTEPHSGILHTTASGEENNLIKLHCDELADQTIASVIVSELEKYTSAIRSVYVDAPNMKIYVKYANTTDANMLLGILERVYLKAYYLDANGVPVYYTKSGNEVFLR